MATIGALVAGGVASAATPPGQLSLFAGNGKSGPAKPGPATQSPLDGPFGVAVNQRGDVYIADAMNNEVEKVSPAGRLSIFAGTGAKGKPRTGRATRSKLDFPTGVAVDGRGNVYIADAGNQEVEKVSPAGRLSIFAGTGTAGASKPGRATRSDLNFPYGVAVDGSRNVYIADQMNNEIEKVTPAGVLSIVAGDGDGAKPTPGPATRSALAFPSGIAVDGSGNLYIADAFNNRIEKVSARGVLSFFAGTGKQGRPKAGRATRSRINHPYGVSVDARGDVYIADTFNQRIEKVTPSGTLSILAGTGRIGEPTAGRALKSKLSQPVGMAIDRQGNLYAANFSGNYIVKVTG